MSNLILSSGIVASGGGAQAAAFPNDQMAAFGGAPAPAGGVDPNADPELALALRMSREEERVRQERFFQAQAKPPATPVSAQPANAPAAPVKAHVPSAATATVPMEDGEEEEEDQDMLAEAIALSMTAEQTALAAGGSASTSAPASTAVPVAAEASDSFNQQEIKDVLQDPDFLSSLLDSVGLNTEVSVDSLLDDLGAPQEQKGAAKKEKKEKKSGKVKKTKKKPPPS